MIKFIVALFFGLCSAANAQLAGGLQFPGPGMPAAAVASFSGLGDVVSGATSYWGFRAYNIAKKGTKLINVCNVADVACADLSSDATTGDLVISTIGGSSCSVVVCTIKIFYDNSGTTNCTTACDAMQATIANRAILIVNCVNGKPCAEFLGSSSQSYTTPGYSPAVVQSHSFSSVVNRTTTTTIGTWLRADSSGERISFNGSANTVAMNMGGTPVTATASDNAWHAIQNVSTIAASGTGSISVDGAAAVTGTGMGTGSWTVSGQIGGVTGQFFTGRLTEIAFYGNKAFSGTEQTNLCHNQFSYWGTATSC